MLLHKQTPEGLHGIMPALIPAYKSARHIDGTLRALSSKEFDPLVVVNGEDDGTVEIARKHGAAVLHIEQAGKFPAIQEGLRKMGKGALQPLAIMDSDTRIVSSRLWRASVEDTLNVAEGPVYMTGPIAFTNRDPLNALTRTAWYNRKTVQNRNIQSAQDMPLGNNHYGPNTVVRLEGEEVLDAVLELPHYWPGEDRAMADTIASHGGHFIPNLDPRMLAITPLSDSYDSLIDTVVRRVRNRVSGSDVKAGYVDNYTKRGPEGSTVYPSLLKDN